eukprot:520702_1
MKLMISLHMINTTQQQNEQFFNGVPNKHQIDREDGHYSSHIIIHPKNDTLINESILITSYYRSPSHSKKFSDIKILRKKINYILQNHKQKKKINKNPEQK